MWRKYMLIDKQIEAFRKDAVELGRDINSMSEFKMWIQAVEDVKREMMEYVTHNIDAEVKAIADYSKFIDQINYLGEAGKIAPESVKAMVTQLEEIRKDEEDHLRILESNFKAKLEAEEL